MSGGLTALSAVPVGASTTLVALLALVLLPTPAAAATDIDDLLTEDSLRLEAWLEPAEAIVVGQEVELVMEVSTPRWFAGGTRIRTPEVDGLVVLRRDEFATNLSRRERGATWVVQQWRLELYPQRSGRFTVPPVHLTLAVNHAEAGIVRGEIATRPLTFEAVVPPGLRDKARWLATPSLSLKQNFDRSPTGLAPGDAFTRTVELRATRIAAMMIPALPVSESEGLAAYPDIPALEDRSNRGEATAIRRQSVTYVVEQPGQYRLPELALTWWNTEKGQVETAILPAVEIDAGGVVAVPEVPAAPVRKGWPWYGTATLLALAFLAALAGLRLLAEDRPLSRARAALRRGDAPAAAAAIYAWLNTREDDWLTLRQRANRVGAGEAAEALLQAGYSHEPPEYRNAGALLRRLKRTLHPQRRATAVSLNPRTAQPRK